MTIHQVIYLPDPRLRVQSEPITVFDDALQTLIDDMFETMYATKGIGLAAPQIGVNKRLGVIDVQQGDNAQQICIINPEIIEMHGEELMNEGCLSLPGIWHGVLRAVKVKVRALNRKGDPFELEAEGLLAHCIQHEIDHLNGKLFIDYLSPLKRSFLIKKFLKLRKRAKQS